MNYNGKKFRSIENTPNGEVSGETYFEYSQRGDLVWATYEGGNIRKGTITGIVNRDGSLHFAYQHVNTKGEICTGLCNSVPRSSPSGKLQLVETWQWTSGDKSRGTSVVEETGEEIISKG